MMWTELDTSVLQIWRVSAAWSHDAGGVVMLEPLAEDVIVTALVSNWMNHVLVFLLAEMNQEWVTVWVFFIEGSEK